MRKPIFDAIRTVRGKPFSDADVTTIDSMCDTLGIARDDADDDDEENGAAAALATAGLDNPTAFYDRLKASGLFPKMKPDQVAGLSAVLKTAGDAGWPISFTAYALATAYHETAGTMQPVREAFWLSEGWRQRNLRYYPYYGRGYVQLTWKANYERADKELGLGGKLLKTLDLAMDPDVASRVMAKGMVEGWFCGDKSGARHTLKRHVSSTGESSEAQYREARRIINGTDKAAKIAGEAMIFQSALKAGGW